MKFFKGGVGFQRETTGGTWGGAGKVIDQPTKVVIPSETFRWFDEDRSRLLWSVKTVINRSVHKNGSKKHRDLEFTLWSNFSVPGWGTPNR